MNKDLIISILKLLLAVAVLIGIILIWSDIIKALL